MNARGIRFPSPAANAAGKERVTVGVYDRWNDASSATIFIPPMKETAFTTFPTSPLNHASAARRGWPHSSPPRPTTGPSRSSVARRSIVGRARRTGIDENVPAGVVTFSNTPEWSISRIGIVALIDTFQVSFSSIGKAQMSRAGSYVVWTVAVNEMLNQPRAVQSALFNWTVRTSFNSARSEARYTAYPSTVAFSITGRNSSSVEEFVIFPSRAASKTLPRWNEPWTVTLYSEPSTEATVRVSVPVRDGLPQVGPAMMTSGGVELTLYVHESPTCHVGTPTDEVCGVFVPDGEPNLTRFAGPNATAATAMPANAIVIAIKPRGLIRIPFLLLRTRRRTREVYGRCETDVEPASAIETYSGMIMSATEPGISEGTPARTDWLTPTGLLCLQPYYSRIQ